MELNLYSRQVNATRNRLLNGGVTDLAANKAKHLFRKHRLRGISRNVIYIKSILGIVARILFLLSSITIVVVLIVLQARKGTPGAEIGVDILSVMGLPVLGLITLVGFGIGFYWEYRRASR